MAKTKITIEYIGAHTKNNAHEYRVLKLCGRPTVEVEAEKDGPYKTVRVGDVITEEQADEVSYRCDLTTIRKAE